MSSIFKACAFILFLNACAPADSTQATRNYADEPDAPVSSSQPDSSPHTASYAPQATDIRMRRGNVMLAPAANAIETLESYPPQFVLILQGSLPTPCHQLRLAVHPADKHRNIHVDAYSVVEPGKMCVQVLQAFEVRVPLGSFPPGHYRVFVNGSRQGEFDA